MALPRRIPVPFGLAFPHGAYAVGEVSPVKDFERSTADRPVQAVDPDSGLLVWQVDVVDGDPEARRSSRTLSVKMHARVQPVLPEAMPGLPFTVVEFTDLTATAWVEEQGDFHRLAWSFRASGVKEPERGIRPLPAGKPDQPAQKAS